MICVAPDDQATHSFAKDQLKAIVERIERIEEERKTISDGIMNVYSEARTPTNGSSKNRFSTRICRHWRCPLISPLRRRGQRSEAPEATGGPSLGVECADQRWTRSVDVSLERVIPFLQSLLR
jgi:hypothetical protein